MWGSDAYGGSEAYMCTFIMNFLQRLRLGLIIRRKGVKIFERTFARYEVCCIGSTGWKPISQAEYIRFEKSREWLRSCP